MFRLFVNYILNIIIIIIIIIIIVVVIIIAHVVVSQCSTTGMWYVLSCMWDGAYKRTLAANRKE